MKKIDLRRINPKDYDRKKLSSEEILSWFENENAYWAYDGEPSPEKPHAELSSGLCTNGFFDCLKILRYPNIAEILAKQLFHHIMRFERMIPMYGELWVVSSSYSAITFGYEAARAMKAVFMMAEKDEKNPKKMVWRRMTVPESARVIQVEELITTSYTFQEVYRAVEEGNQIKPVYFIPTVAALVHRPEKLPADYNGRQVAALIEKEVHVYKPGDCPYCKVGSPRYRPKTHWSELIGR